MDNFQFWFYIIVAVIYVISRVLKKKDQAPGNLPDNDRPFTSSENTGSGKGERPLTFEELLKEITESKKEIPGKPYQQPSAIPKRQAEYVDYDDDLGEEAQDLEDVDYDHKKKDNVYEVYENAKKQAFLQPSLEETLKVLDTDMKYGRFKEFESERQQSVLNDYLKEFRDPEGLKKAVVMSEILKRKF